MSQFFRASLLIFILLLTGALTQESKAPVPIEENQRLVFQMNSGDKINLLYSKRVYLYTEVLVLFQPTNRRNAMDEMYVYFSLNTSDPSEGNYKSKCIPKKFEPCTFEFDPKAGEDLNVKNLTIGVLCVDSESCEFDVTILHNEELFLESGVVREFKSRRLELETFNFTVPAKEKFSRFVVSIHLKSGYLSSDNIGFHPQLSFSFGKPIYRELPDRLVAYFEHEQLPCFECNMTAMVLSPIGTVYEIVFREFNNTSAIKIDIEYLDFIKKGQINLYMLELSSPLVGSERDLKIFFSLDSLTGNGKLMYVNPEVNLDDPRGSIWVSKSGDDYYNEEEDIVVSQLQLTNYHILGQKFFIAVISDNPGLYVLRVKVMKERIIPLHLGVMDYDTLNINELQNYELEIIEDDEDLDSLANPLQIIAQVELGTVSIYSRFCADKDNQCFPITLTQITESKAPGNQPFDYFDEVNGNHKMLIKPKCPASRSKHCYLQIAVLGTSNKTKSSKYGLLAKRESLLINLVENKVHQTHISEDSVQMFRFYLEDPNDDALKLKVTVSAELEIHGVKHNFCFTGKISCYLNETLLGTKGKPLIWKKETEGQLGDYYYFMVMGSKTSSYQIYPEVTRSSHNSQVVSKLFDGKLTQGILTLESPKAYFKFQVDFHERTDIEVFIQGDTGRFKMFISNEDFKLPSEERYYWASHNNYILISKHNLDYYQSSDIYNILVQPQNIEDLQFKNLSFSIMYASPQTVRFLENSEIFYDSMNGNDTRDYTLLITPDKGHVFFTLDVLSPQHSEADFNVYFFAGVYQWNVPSRTKKERSSFKLSKDDLISYCNEQQFECPLFVKIHNNGSKSNSYSFSVRAFTQDYAIKLRDGIEQEFPLGDEIDSLKLYLEPISSNNSVDIFMYTYHLRFELLISISKSDGKPLQGKYPNPTILNTFVYALPTSTKTSFTIKPEAFKTCKPDCIIYMTVVLEKNETGRLTESELGNDQTLQVLVSSDLAHLYPGHPLIFSVSHKEWQYFSVQLKNTSETHIFSMTRMTGDALIVVKIVDDSMANIRPTEENFDFIIHYDYFVITPKDINDVLAKRKGNKNSNLSIIVGVFGMGSQDTQYQINCYTESHPILRLIPGAAQDVTLGNSQSLYFEFSNFRNENFKIMFNRENGIGLMSVTACITGRILSSCMEDSDFQTKIRGASSAMTTITRGSRLFCVGCTYVIKLTGIEFLTGSMTVTYSDEFYELEDGKLVNDFALAKSHNIYSFAANTSQPIEININVITGSPTMFLNFFYDPEFKLYQMKYPLSSETNLRKTTIFIPPRDSLEFERLFPEIAANHKPVTPSEDPSMPSLNAYAHINRLYLAIDADNAETSYSIMYRASMNEINLNAGVVQFGRVKPGESRIYSFRKSEADKRVTISLNLYNGTFDNIGSQLYYRNDKEKADILSGKYEEIRPWSLVGSNTDKIFNITKNNNGAYQLHVWNDLKAKDPLTIDYSIVWNTKGVISIPYNADLQSSLDPHEYKYYESYIPFDGVLAVQLLECKGEVDVKLTDKYTNLDTQNFDYLVEKGTGNSYLNTVPVKKGMAYFGLISSSNAYFKLTTRLFKNYNDIPESKLVARTTADVLWSYSPETRFFTIEFDPIACSRCDTDELWYSKVSYDLIVTNDDSLLNGMIKCGHFYDGLERPQFNFTKVMGINHSLQESSMMKKIVIKAHLLTGVKFFLGIQAHVYGMKNSGDRPIRVEYNNFELFVAPQPGGGEFSAVLFFVTFGIFCFLLIGFVFYYRKYKHTQKILTYEMQEIKNAVQFSGMNLSVSEDTQQSIENKRIYVGIDETNN